MLNELFARMQYEPSVLVLGNEYKNLSTVVLDYAWNSIVTTNCDMALSAFLVNDRRFVRDVTSKDDMQSNLMDRKNLHVIRVFGEK